VNEFDEAALVLVATDRDDQVVRGADDAVAERHAPQPVFADLLSTRVSHGAQESTGVWIECVDLAAVLVADQQRVGELAPRVRRDNHAPRTIKDAAGYQSTLEMTAKVEHIDDTLHLCVNSRRRGVAHVLIDTFPSPAALICLARRRIDVLYAMLRDRTRPRPPRQQPGPVAPSLTQPDVHPMWSPALGRAGDQPVGQTGWFLG
jgi:hypothetical protein